MPLPQRRAALLATALLLAAAGSAWARSLKELQDTADTRVIFALTEGASLDAAAHHIKKLGSAVEDEIGIG